MTMSSAQTWAKALTAMEAGCSVARNTADEWWVCGPMEELDCILGKTAVEAAAAACDALSLPWQEHPVWLMWELLEAIDKAECYESALSIGLAADVRAFVASAKGGG